MNLATGIILDASINNYRKWLKQKLLSLSLQLLLKILIFIISAVCVYMGEHRGAGSP